jgi:general secretion pathway protein H
MPRSGPGNRSAGGFTLIEIMVVMAIIAIAVAVIAVSLRDSRADQLEREGARLAALLESARAEARAAAVPARWLPVRDQPAENFRFEGLPLSTLPTRWLDATVQAQIVGAAAVMLGPDPILPAQRIVLHLEERRVEVASDGLGPFAVVGSGPGTP